MMDVSFMALILLIFLLVFLPFWPALSEALWGRDKKPTPVTDRQLVDLRDSPGRVWDLVKLKKPGHYREIQKDVLSVEHTETLYCRGSLALEKTQRLFELHVEDQLQIHSELTVAWWLTAKEVQVHAPLVAVGKIQALRCLQISAGVQFHQLQAEEIEVRGSVDHPITLPLNTVNSNDRHIKKHGWRFRAGEAASGDWVVHGDVVFEEGALLYGSLKVWGSLHLGPGAVITDNVFVTAHATLEKGSGIGGVFVVEKKLSTHGGVTLGRRDAPISVVAEEMYLHGGLHAHGLLKAWKRGVLVTTDSLT